MSLICIFLDVSKNQLRFLVAETDTCVWGHFFEVLLETHTDWTELLIIVQSKLASWHFKFPK